MQLKDHKLLALYHTVLYCCSVAPETDLNHDTKKTACGKKDEGEEENFEKEKRDASEEETGQREVSLPSPLLVHLYTLSS